MWHDFRHLQFAVTMLTDQDSDVDDAGNTAHEKPMTGRKTMQFKSILAAAGLAVAATIGLASAAERFATLDGIAAGPMTAEELSSVRGGVIVIRGLPPMDTRIITDGVFQVKFVEDKLTVEAFKPADFPNFEVKVG